MKTDNLSFSGKKPDTSKAEEIVRKWSSCETDEQWDDYGNDYAGLIHAIDTAIDEARLEEAKWWRDAWRLRTWDDERSRIAKLEAYLRERGKV